MGMKPGEGEGEDAVVLVESGVGWDARSLPGSVAPCAVIQEAPDEPEARLLARLHSCFAQLAATGLQVRTAVLACGEGSDSQRMLVRARIVCRLLALMADASRIRLILCTCGKSASNINDLLALGGALIESWIDAGVAVEVRQIATPFEEPKTIELTNDLARWSPRPMPLAWGTAPDATVADQAAS